MYSVGNQIGVGKESGALFSCLSRSLSDVSRQDIYIVADSEGHEMVLKLHRYIIFISQNTEISLTRVFS
jgi:RIO-like serine/threonine protein kinase